MSQRENQLIFEALVSLERNYKLRAEAMKAEGVKINGFTMLKRTWCYIILKPTDIGKQPQYKGEELVKIIPETIKLRRVYVDMALKSQSWTYY